MLLPTVRSRCQRLRFGPLTPGDVADVLIRDHGMTRRRSARGRGRRGRQRRPRDRRRAPRTRRKRATPRRGCCRERPTSTDPRRRLDGAKALTGGGGDRDELSRRLLALSSLLRDLGLLAARADERRAGQRRSQAAAAVAARDRTTATARSRRSRSSTARCDALDRNASPKIVADWLALNLLMSGAPAFVSVKFTPVGRTVSFLLPDLHDRRADAGRAGRRRTAPTGLPSAP